MSIRNELLEQILAAINTGGGSLPADNCRIGWADYNDLATATTPIQLTGGALPVKLTNDSLGAQTSTAFLPVGVTEVWDSTTNEFNFSQLKTGDMVDIRIAAEVTTTAPNQSFSLDLKLGIGGFDYNIPFAGGIVKNTGTILTSRFNGIYIADDNTRLNPAHFEISSDEDADVRVLGWYCKILIRG